MWNLTNNPKEAAEAGNFWFLRSDFQNLYKCFLTAESLYWIDMKACAANLRSALAGYVSLCEEFKSAGKVQDINIKDTELDDDALFKRIQNLGGNYFHKMPPKFRIQLRNGKSHNVDKSDYLIRKVANAGHHSGDAEEFLTRKNLELAFKAFYQDLLAFEPIKPKPPTGQKFNVHCVPIVTSSDGQKIFFIDAWGPIYNIADSSEIYLYRAHTLDNRHVLMYRYNQENQQIKHYQRAALSDRIRSVNMIQNGLTRILDVGGTEEFLFFAYLFEREPREISPEVLSKIDAVKKKEICRKLAAMMAELHDATPKVFHRMLTDKALVLTESKKSIIPNLIDFDFIKVIEREPQDSDEAYKLDNTVNYIVRQNSTRKYIPPELKQDGTKAEIRARWRNPDWERYDIFSLGVLFKDIFDNLGSPDEVNINDLSVKYGDSVSGEWWRIIEDMCAENPAPLTMREIVRRMKDADKDNA